MRTKGPEQTTLGALFVCRVHQNKECPRVPADRERPYLPP